MKICPKCGSRSFFVTAHVTQDWEVDENGEFVKVICDCGVVTHSPDDNDIWECAECDYSDSGEAFEVTDKRLLRAVKAIDSAVRAGLIIDKDRNHIVSVWRSDDGEESLRVMTVKEAAEDLLRQNQLEWLEERVNV